LYTAGTRHACRLEAGVQNEGLLSTLGVLIADG